MKNKQPIVYVARPIMFYNGTGEAQEVARFVSKAHLQESFTKYFADGFAKNEYLVQYNFVPEILILQNYSGFDIGYQSSRVDEVFMDYKTCKERVNELNKSLAGIVLDVAPSMEKQKLQIHDLAVQFGQRLDEEYISFEERGRPRGIRYLVAYHSEMAGLPAETAGELNVVNMLTGNVFWFDNENLEWLQSIYSAETTISALGEEFVEVESFDNGYVNTNDLWDTKAANSLIRRYPSEFEDNIGVVHEKEKEK